MWWLLLIAMVPASADRFARDVEIVFAETACDNGHGWGCYDAAKLLATKGPERAEVLFRRGCELGHGRSCVRVGRDTADVGLLVRGCELGAGDGCALLGQRQRAADPVRALQLLARACALESELGCGEQQALHADLHARWPARPEKPGRRCGLGRRASGVELEGCLLGANGVDELTLTEMLLVASGVESAAELDAQVKRLHQAVAVMAGLARAQKGDLAQEIVRVMHAFHVGRYRSGLGDLRITLHAGDYNCVTATLLYVLAARRAGLQASVFSREGHVLAVVFGTGAPRFVETTAPEATPRSPWDPGEDFEVAGGGRINATGAVTWTEAMERDLSGLDPTPEKMPPGFDVPTRSLASMLYWNRGLTAAQGGDHEAALRALRGVLQLGTPEMIERTWAVRAQELRALTIELARERGWRRAADMLDVLMATLAGKQERAALEQFHASVYLRWLKRAGEDMALVCEVLERFVAVLPNHQAARALREQQIAKRCWALR